MAKDPYNYSWYMSLTYEQWARSTNWILTKMQKDHSEGKLTEQQFKNIMARRDKLYKDKVDAALAKKTNKTDLGTHTYIPPAENEQPKWDDMSFFEKVGYTVNTVIPAAGGAVDQTLDNAGDTIKQVGSVGSFLVVGGVIFLVIKLIKK